MYKGRWFALHFYPKQEVVWLNQFRFDSHEPDRKFSIITVSLLSGVIAAFLVLAAIRFTGLGAMLTGPVHISPGPTVSYSLKNFSINEYEKSIIEVYNRVKPSVVMITTDTLVEEFDFFNGSSLRNIQGLGSGVVFRQDGYILTNKHVVSGAEGRKVSQISVVLSNGKSYPAKIVGFDSQIDLAVLKIDHSQLAVLDWGNSEKVQVGQTAIAIGNPLTENLQNTVTTGVVSATGRLIKLNTDYEIQMIQTDASINPGNSGGPLLNSAGQIIGINTAIAAQSQGIGFSIPSNTVKSAAIQLIEKGYVSRPGLGVFTVLFTPENVGYLEARLRRNLPVKSGLFVARVFDGTPADQAGLRGGDIIYGVDGKKIQNGDLVRETVTKQPIGTKVELDIYRENRKMKIIVKIGEMRKQEEV